MTRQLFTHYRMVTFFTICYIATASWGLLNLPSKPDHNLPGITPVFALPDWAIVGLSVAGLLLGLLILATNVYNAWQDACFEAMSQDEQENELARLLKMPVEEVLTLRGSSL
ncbi:MAG: hypothetical protein ACREPQ_14260 [Rhodanobacter sp.]